MTDLPQVDVDVLSTPKADGEGRFTAEAPQGWLQSKGTFGGWVTAVLTRALEAATPGRPLRSLAAELIGPVQPGPVSVEVRPLRVGNAVTTSTVLLSQGGELMAHGVGVLGKARPQDRDGVRLAEPARPNWRVLEPLPLGPPIAPDFTRAFEFRLEKHLPFGGGDARTEGWIRPRRPGKLRDAGTLAMAVDCWWPAVWSLETTPRPMVTVAFTFQPFPRFHGLDPEAPYFHRARAVAGLDGYFVEYRELWGEDGRLLALNTQTFVLLK